MLNIADLPDLKYIQIENSSNAFGISETRTLKHQSPPDRLCFIESIMLQGTQEFTINGMLIDKEEVLRTPTTLLINAVNYYFQANKAFGSGANVTSPVMLIPFRRLIEPTIAWGVVAGDLTWRVWAYVHQDREAKFQTMAALQGQ